MKKAKAVPTDPYDTAVLPPGGDVGGGDLPDRGQRYNLGYGATPADLNRTYLDEPEPPMYENPSKADVGQLDGGLKMSGAEGKGFVGRTPLSSERN